MEKKLSKKALLGFICVAVLLFAVALVMTSCKKSDITSIVIKDSDLPRTTYVEGQELDLSDGKITALSKKNESLIPMTDSEVQVSGYDKNTLGKQTLTVTYQKMTTTFEVNVIARMVADGYKTEYFKDEEFDKTKGKLKITKDDGKTTTVPFDSELVTIVFNNTVAGNVPVTAVYDDKQGTRYETTFTVKCYEMGDITFVKPSKTVYQSHDTELAVKGGFFNVKASGSEYSIPVPLTIDMTSGFNPSAATAANRKTPLSQTITCTYGGKSFEFKISILYSGVSVVLDAAKALANVNVTGKDFTLDENLANVAVNAASEYFKLTNDKKALISTDDVLKVMRPAALCTSEKFMDAAEGYASIFKIDANNGNILIDTQNKADLVSLKDTFNTDNDPFSVYADILIKIKEEFKDVVLYTEEDDKGEAKDVTFDSFVKAPNEEQRTFYKSLFEHMIVISEKLDVIPDDWSMDSTSDKYLDKYSTAIEEVFSKIINSRFSGPTFYGTYNSISLWRTNNDFYEIFYNYYLEIADEDTKNNFIENGLNNGLKFPLPGELQIWYSYLNLAYGEVVHNMVVTNEYGETTIWALYDTTLYMYYYNKTVESAKSILNGTIELEKTVFNLINADMVMYNYLEAPYTAINQKMYPNGYLYFTMMAPDSENLSNIRKSYMEIMTLYFENQLNLNELEGHEDLFSKMFEDLAKLNPTELYAFISSVNFYYSGADEYVLDYSNKIWSYFPLLVTAYEKHAITNTEVLPLRQLLKAMELCAQIGAKATVEDFRAAMAELKAMMEGTDLSADDKAAFMDIAGDCYNKYLGIYNTIAEPTDFGGFKDEYDELKATLKDFLTVYSFITEQGLNAEESQKRVQYYLLFFALSEKAIRLHNDIVENAPAEVVNALYTVKYNLNGTDNVTMENAFALLSSLFYGRLMEGSLPVSQNSHVAFWTVYYREAKLRDFMVDLATPLMSYYNQEAIDMDSIRALMTKFRTLTTATEKKLFSSFGMGVYYNMLLDTFAKDNEAIAKFVTNLLQAEIFYADYLQNPAEQGRIDCFVDGKEVVENNIVTGTVGMSTAISEYTALGTEGQNNLDQALKDMYDFYKSLRDEIIESTSDSSSEGSN